MKLISAIATIPPKATGNTAGLRAPPTGMQIKVLFVSSVINGQKSAIEEHLRKRYYRIRGAIVSTIVIRLAQLSKTDRCKAYNAPRTESENCGEEIHKWQVVSEGNREPCSVDNCHSKGCGDDHGVKAAKRV
jgi:hypothetical protein